MATQFGPNAGIGEGNDGKWQEVLQDQHGDAVDGAVRVFTGPLLHTDLRGEPETQLNVMHVRFGFYIGGGG